MKKLFTIALAALICAAMLAACEGKQAESESQQESPAESLESSSENFTPQAVNPPLFVGENGEYGLLDENGNVIVEPVYDSAVAYENFAVFSRLSDTGPKAVIVDFSGKQIGPEYDSVERESFDELPGYYSFVGKITEGERPEIRFDGPAPYIEYAQNVLCLLLDEFGRPIADRAFLNYWLTGGDDEPVVLMAAADGAYYEYTYENGGFTLTKEELPTEYKDEFGYTCTRYCYSWHDGWRHGIKSPKGDIIAGPVYKMLNVPFADRVILYEGVNPNHGWDCGRVKLVGSDGKVFSNCFSTIKYTVFEDGSYIGVAVCAGPEAEVKCYDEKGDLMPDGFWFVDKDGRIISERFLSLDFRDEGEEYYEYGPESPDDTAVAITESGETVRISVEEYICEP